MADTEIPRIHAEDDVAAIVRTGALAARGIAPPADGALADEIERSITELRGRHGGATAGQIEHLRAARELYRAIGLDPTRHRPSPEALLRRLLRGDPFPAVHPAVDLGNLWAILHGLPVGLYDLARVRGPVTLRRGRPGESYEGIRKGEVHLEGRLVLADEHGPFGNPTSDSLRTSVDGTSRDLLYVVFAPTGYDAAGIDRWLDWLRERVLRHLRPA